MNSTLTATNIRKAFLDFFESKGHKIVSSAPMVVKNDPTLMFTNAGMNQFKDWFLGNEPARYKRIADTQKCLRVSGKHNDLEEVGIDTYHHTMFEMLGNWSFGDYFKKEAIEWAWELLTKVYQLDASRLYVTVFEGSESDGLELDTEAMELWKSLISPERILKGNKKDNFWEMGDQGPCGPCTEIHFDSRTDAERAAISGATLVNNDHPQVIEIWNLVFMEFNRKADGSLEKLPAQHVDTGMGFERLCRVLQGKQSNYDSDVFKPLLDAIGQLTGMTYTGSDSKQDIAFRVISDHIRAISFAIADGQLPSNTGAGYVIRRILRRAVRYAYSFLNQKQPILHQLVVTLANQMGEFFPELQQQQSFVSKVILEEEQSFLRTLGSGMTILEGIMSKSTSKEISGLDAFTLYDTHGFPLDLTQLIAREGGFTVDEVGFNKGLAEQKARSRKDAEVETADWIQVDTTELSRFVGYDTLKTQTKILRYRKVQSKGKTRFQLVLEETPFYAESGGQVGDKGVLIQAGKQIQITDTQKENNLIIHWADELPTELTEPVIAQVDSALRASSARNHSATHILQAALKEVLGEHIQQKGSLVTPDYLRFDFSHFAKMSLEEIRQVENRVNEQIRNNTSLLELRDIPVQEALDKGATALFGEKYGDTVRVIIFDQNFSMELCGGTHVPALGSIGLFKITSESAVAAGVRRIEACTGEAALQMVQSAFDIQEQLKEALNQPKDLLKAIESLKEESSMLKKQLEAFQHTMLLDTRDALLSELGTSHFIIKKLQAPSADWVKDLSYQLHQNNKGLATVIGANIEGKPHIAIMFDTDLVTAKQWNAGQMVKEVGKFIQGGGGGQPFFATAGGQNVNGLDEALQWLRNKLTE